MFALSHLWERVPEGRERALVQRAQRLLDTHSLLSLSPNPSPASGRGELKH